MPSQGTYASPVSRSPAESRNRPLCGFWPELRASKSRPGRDGVRDDDVRFGSRSSTAIPRPKANAAGPTVHERRRRDFSAALSLLERAWRGPGAGGGPPRRGTESRRGAGPSLAGRLDAADSTPRPPAGARRLPCDAPSGRPPPQPALTLMPPGPAVLAGPSTTPISPPCRPGSTCGALPGTASGSTRWSSTASRCATSIEAARRSSYSPGPRSPTSTWGS
jgi:hypothetical protein